MNCPNCNSNINQGENFCRVCGKQINIQQSQSEYSEIPTWNLTSNQINNISNEATNNNVNLSQQNLQNQQDYNFQNNTINHTIQNNNQVNQQSFKPQTVFNSPYQQTIKNDPCEDDKLIDAYIGKRVYGITKGGFSWCTFFFGVFYVYYRKMLVFGIIWSALNIVINNLLRSLEYLSLVVGLILNIVMGCIFKEKYLQHVNKKVEEIKQKNPDKSHEELLHICRKKGGTSILIILIYILILFGIAIIETLPQIKIYLDAREKYNEIYENNVEVSNTEKTTLGNLNLEVPTIFKLRTNQSNKYTSSYYTSSSICELSISSTDSNNYNSIRQYMENNRSFKEDTTFNDIQEKIINNNKWNYLTTTVEVDEEGLSNKKNNIVTHLYAISKENKIYGIEIIIYKDENNICSNAKDMIINSSNFN